MKAELMSVHLAQVNDETKTVRDFVQSVVVGKNKIGIVVHFETTEKYVEIDVINTGGQKIICIIPSALETSRGWVEAGDPEFYNHPDYYEIHIQIKTDNISCAEVVTPLKHEYFVNLIPIANLCDYDAI
jgi:hypothetical protein